MKTTEKIVGAILWVVYRLPAFMAGAALVIALYAWRKEKESTDWRSGFDDGMTYTIKMYQEKKLLRVPEEPMPANFEGCIFVTVLDPPSPIRLSTEEGGGTLVTHCFFSSGILSTDMVTTDAYDRFMREHMSKEPVKDYPSAELDMSIHVKPAESTQ